MNTVQECFILEINLKRNGSNKELIKEFEKDVITKNSSIKASGKDKLILLSTCNSSDTETRSVLVGKITEVEESKIINEKKDITLNQIDKQLSDKQKEENAKEIIKDKEENNTYAKKIIIMIVIIVIIIILIIVYYLFKRKKEKENEKLKTTGKHMK